MADHNVEEKGVDTPTQHSANGSTEEKQEPAYHHDETGLMESMRAAAERGHLATDKSVFLHPPNEIRTHLCNRYGRPIVTFDPKAEAKLLLKIDLYIVPTVSLLYLFCFIDRANIGMFS